MRFRRRILVLGPFLCLLVMLYGCGLMRTKGPPMGHEQMYHFECTESRGGPVIDLFLAGVYAFATLDLMTGGDEFLNEDQGRGASMLITGAWTGLFTTSGVVGLKKVSRCREARRALAERLATAGPTDPVVHSVAIVPDEVTLAPGEKAQLTATALNATGLALPGRSFSWTSSNPNVASVNPMGLVTGRAEGRVLIAANTGGVVGTAEVVVAQEGVQAPDREGRMK